MVPKIESDLGLDAEGNFTFADLSAFAVVRQSSRLVLPHVLVFTYLNSSHVLLYYSILTLYKSTASISFLRSMRFAARIAISKSDPLLEEQAADRRKKMSFAEIDGREKRAVFQLGPVHRAKRHLPYSAILMREDVLHISRRYMEVGPHRRSILQIGYTAINANPMQLSEGGYREERSYIHQLLRFVLDLQATL